MAAKSAIDLLFVYGTLLDADERRRLLRREIEVTPARLEGYKRGRGRYYFVAERAGGSVTGAILRGLTHRDFEILDEYEDVPKLYTRHPVTVSEPGGSRLKCWIYIPTGWEREGGRERG